MPNSYNALRAHHQTLKATVMWLVFLEYNAAIKSTESVTKTVVKLPGYMRSKFYGDFEIKLQNEIEFNLEVSLR